MIVKKSSLRTIRAIGNWTSFNAEGYGNMTHVLRYERHGTGRVADINIIRENGNILYMVFVRGKKSNTLIPVGEPTPDFGEVERILMEFSEDILQERYDGIRIKNYCKGLPHNAPPLRELLNGEGNHEI